MCHSNRKLRAGLLAFFCVFVLSREAYGPNQNNGGNSKGPGGDGGGTLNAFERANKKVAFNMPNKDASILAKFVEREDKDKLISVALVSPRAGQILKAMTWKIKPLVSRIRRLPDYNQSVTGSGKRMIESLVDLTSNIINDKKQFIGRSAIRCRKDAVDFVKDLMELYPDPNERARLLKNSPVGDMVAYISFVLDTLQVSEAASSDSVVKTNEQETSDAELLSAIDEEAKAASRGKVTRKNPRRPANSKPEVAGAN